jgi:hypothetical protein
LITLPSFTRVRDVVIQVLQGYGLLSVPIRFLIVAFVSALGGSGFIGLLSEFAAYRYALAANCRPPFEGIPYLRATVTATTFMLFVTAAAVFALTYLFVARIAAQIATLERLTKIFSLHLDSQTKIVTTLLKPERLRELLDKLPWRWQIGILLGVPGFATIIATGIIFLLRRDTTELLQFSFAAYLYTFLVTTLLYNPGLTKLYALLVAAFFIVAAPVLLFHVPTYSRLLASLRYGGGIPVVVELSTTDRPTGTLEAGELVLRSSSALFLRDIKTRLVREIPMERVVGIQYSERR